MGQNQSTVADEPEVQGAVGGASNNGRLNPSEIREMKRLGIVEVAGDDRFGRKVIVMSAHRIPSDQHFDYQKLLKYILLTLDVYVEQDYVIVYFHQGGNTTPEISWLWQVHEELDRKYKKNLKMLYVVHPTRFIKFLWNVLWWYISAKFGRKLMYVNHLAELRQLLYFDQLPIPAPVLEFDQGSSPSHEPPTSDQRGQQFGRSLQEIKQNTDRVFPPPIEEPIGYLKDSGAVEVEGLFRKSAKVAIMKEVQAKYDEGEKVDFRTYGDPHLAAGILKKFLRELPEPLMTYALFEEITRVHSFESNRQLQEVRRILQDRLPEHNYIILKFIVQFLKQVASKSSVNLMTPQNIAIVFGPNIAWPRGQASLQTTEPTITFTSILIVNFNEVFVR